MKQLCDLLFELSSEERMSIIQNLCQQNIRLSHLAQKLDMTVTETSRQLQRLSDAELISRNSEGLYNTTSFGELLLSLIPSIHFVSKNRAFFLSHDVSNIPIPFVNRFGELVSSSFEVDAVKVIARVTNILNEADEFIWSHSYHILPSHIPILEKKVGEGVEFKGIYLNDFETSSQIASNIRSVEKIELRILVTEKEAMTGFLSSSGQPDYSAFFSFDPMFINWCKELFQYYWGKTR